MDSSLAMSLGHFSWMSEIPDIYNEAMMGVITNVAFNLVWGYAKTIPEGFLA